MGLLAWCRGLMQTLPYLHYFTSCWLKQKDWLIFIFYTDKYSFGNILAQYELWVQNVSDITPRIECKAQQMFMSDYQFETDKIPNAPKTQGDGGYLEEVWYIVLHIYIIFLIPFVISQIVAS